jgi:hypothetical protein
MEPEAPGQSDSGTHVESVEIPLYDVSSATGERAGAGEPAASGRACRGAGRAARERPRACARPNKRGLRRVRVGALSRDHGGGAVPPSRPAWVDPAPRRAAATRKPWEDLPPLVAIDKYCSSDNPLQRLSWSGVRRRRAGKRRRAGEQRPRPAAPAAEAAKPRSQQARALAPLVRRCPSPQTPAANRLRRRPPAAPAARRAPRAAGHIGGRAVAAAGHRRRHRRAAAARPAARPVRRRARGGAEADPLRRCAAAAAAAAAPRGRLGRAGRAAARAARAGGGSRDRAGRGGRLRHAARTSRVLPLPLSRWRGSAARRARAPAARRNFLRAPPPLGPAAARLAKGGEVGAGELDGLWDALEPLLLDADLEVGAPARPACCARCACLHACAVLCCAVRGRVRSLARPPARLPRRRSSRRGRGRAIGVRLCSGAPGA